MTDKLDLSSPDFVNENLEKIAALFPNCVTEGPHGKVVDFDLLKQELNHDVIEGTKERYRLEWPGKRQAMVNANLPTTKTLRPVRENSVDFDNTENLYIEGDNLEVLKILQESYLGKIKLIYIDPPYNTGKDFVYKDNFNTNSKEYMKDSGQKDEVHNLLVSNPETSGRYHSDWLSMIAPRIALARKMLRPDGIIAISIDDHEVENLKKLCQDIFGEDNFLAQVVWERAYAPVNLKRFFSESHDYILVFAKDKSQTNKLTLSRSAEANSRYKNPDDDSRGPWKAENSTVGPANDKNVYSITTPSGRVVTPPSGRSWVYSKERMDEMIGDNRIWFGKSGGNVPAIKRFLVETKSGITPMTLWKYTEVGHSQTATKELKALFDGKAMLDYPKPVSLISRIIELATDENDIVMDFFSGSATTAHSTMSMNSTSNRALKYILVQLAETTPDKSTAREFDFSTICQIGQERIRRAAAKIKEETGADIDYGFRVYKLDSSNMEDVYHNPQNYDQGQLDLLADNVKSDRTAEDLLTQVILAWGLPLSLQIEEEKVVGKQVFKVAGNSLYACFDSGIDEEFAKEIAKEEPLRVVFKDSAFASDTAKVNVQQLLKQLSPNTEMKVI